jgi:hypothetical protein
MDGSKSDFDRSPSRQEIAARSDAATAKVAVLWRGDHLAPRVTTLKNNRFSRIFEEFAALGVHVEPVVYADDIAGDLHEQLLKLDGVLVWVDPISEGQNRTTLDAMLREVASEGVWVGAHPDVILKMGVKQVLHRTKHLGWGTDTRLYLNARVFREAFPPRLPIGRASCAQAEPRQRRPGCVEGRIRIVIG